MTLEEAIMLNKDAVDSLRQHGQPKHADGVQLGIEALRHYQEARKLYVSKDYPLLPGESAGTDTP